MINTIILDLDGPLLDGMQRHYQCYSDILIENSMQPVPLQMYWNMKRNRVKHKKLLALSEAYSLYDEFPAIWIQRIETKKYLVLDKLQYRVLEILSNWKKSGIQLFLATMRNDPVNLKWQLDKLNILHLLDELVVVGSNRTRDSKSSAIRPLLQGIDLDKVVWVGDTEVDVYAARDLGVRVCALTCGLRTPEYLTSLSPDSLEFDLNAFAETVLKTYIIGNNNGQE